MPERAGAESEEEFVAIVARYHGEIHRYLCRLARHAGDGEDLSQETFLNAYRAWPGLPRDANHRAWLYRIATNLYRNHVRSAARRRVAHATVRLTRREVDVDGPEGVVAAEQIRARTEATIDRLPLKQRVAFTLRKLHDLDYEAIGASLACSPESARAHVFQALRKIRKALDGPAPSRMASTR
jgi:RNA polymerase sigma-70 factor, ECF subfamily